MSGKKLQPHQKAFVKAFIRSNNRGALAIHGAGTGKTLLAVTVSKCYLDLHPRGNITVITPASLLAGFRKELNEWSDAEFQKQLSKYKFYTYSGFLNNGEKCENDLLIIDEAQNLRNKDGAMFKAIWQCAMEANKVLLLSATPIINELSDLSPLMSMIHGRPPLTSNEYDMILKYPKLARVYFGCLLSFFENNPERTKKYFPTVRVEWVPIKMDDSTLKLYNNLEKDKSTKRIINIFDLNTGDKDLQSFFNGLRRVSSGSDQKHTFIVEFIKHVINKRPSKKLGITEKMLSSHTDKCIIFTHFKSHGSKLLIKQLKAAGIEVGLVDGSITKVKRAEIVDRYVNGIIKVILISAAGSTGLNLFETGYMFLVEPSWNESEVIQVMARANRYMSHSNLPQSKRNVLVMKLMLIKPDETNLFGTVFKNGGINYKHIHPTTMSIDVKMVIDSYHKQAEIEKHLHMLQTKIPSLEKPNCDVGRVDTIYNIEKLDPIPRMNSTTLDMLNKQGGYVVPRGNGIRVMPKLAVSDNIPKWLVSMSGVKRVSTKLTTLMIGVDLDTIVKFLEVDGVHIHLVRSKSIPNVKQLPRIDVVGFSQLKKYKLSVCDLTREKFNIEILDKIFDACDIIIMKISYQHYNYTPFQKWLSSKIYKTVRVRNKLTSDPANIVLIQILHK